MRSAANGVSEHRSRLGRCVACGRSPWWIERARAGPVSEANGTSGERALPELAFMQSLERATIRAKRGYPAQRPRAGRGLSAATDECCAVSVSTFFQTHPPRTTCYTHRPYLSITVAHSRPRFRHQIANPFVSGQTRSFRQFFREPLRFTSKSVAVLRFYCVFLLSLYPVRRSSHERSLAISSECPAPMSFHPKRRVLDRVVTRPGKWG